MLLAGADDVTDVPITRFRNQRSARYRERQPENTEVSPTPEHRNVVAVSLSVVAPLTKLICDIFEVAVKGHDDRSLSQVGFLDCVIDLDISTSCPL